MKFLLTRVIGPRGAPPCCKSACAPRIPISSRADRWLGCEAKTNLVVRLIQFFSRFSDSFSNLVDLALRLLPRTFAPRRRGQIAKAVSYLHECGIAHGDLKPDNIVADRRCGRWPEMFCLTG